MLKSRLKIEKLGTITKTQVKAFNQRQYFQGSKTMVRKVLVKAKFEL